VDILLVVTNQQAQAMLVTTGRWPHPAPSALHATIVDRGILVQSADGRIMGAVPPDGCAELMAARSVHLGCVEEGLIHEVGQAAIRWRVGQVVQENRR
jgi:hypothetical protein